MSFRQALPNVNAPWFSYNSPMTSLSAPEHIIIRSVQYRDLEAIEALLAETPEIKSRNCPIDLSKHLQQIRQWYGLLKFVSFFPNPLRHLLCVYVAEHDRQLCGTIQVSPFNRTRSTWRVDRITLQRANNPQKTLPPLADIGSQLLRHCLDTIWEARTWLLEVNVNDKTALALYRQTGFQRLAQITYWSIAPDLLQTLATNEPDLPNLLPVSNADAQLLYQLDTVAMPPLVRQVFDRHVRDFKTSLFSALFDGLRQWWTRTEVVSGYVFEPQRKAAIGYFQLKLHREGNRPHVAQLTVHPAYTWLYPELLSQMARIAQDFPAQALQLASSDYQPEREEYLEKMGAERIEHTLMMSRSVWHKLREAKPVSLEGLQLPEVLKGLQPAPPGKPVPGRMSGLQSVPQIHSNGKHHLSSADFRPTDFRTQSPNRSESETRDPDTQKNAESSTHRTLKAKRWKAYRFRPWRRRTHSTDITSDKSQRP